MIKISKTLNPLHFEDLEPHRFEDLIRQLIYDFRNWRVLEPTGRLGSDDGYDARGFEIVRESDYEDLELVDSENEDINATEFEERLWQIQCKREKTITPQKIKDYVDDMIVDGGDIPQGVIFAAPCDFSKKTHDAFREKMAEKGVNEFYIWGKASLEDMLMLPKNDHLLFAYFGVSLAIKKRAIKNKIRALLAIKRKTAKHLGPIEEDCLKEVLVRDANDENYPYAGKIPDFQKNPTWKKFYFVGHSHNGIRLRNKRFPAYKEIDSQTGELVKWDFIEEVNLGVVNKHSDPWNRDEKYDDDFKRAHDFLDKMEEKNQAFLDIEGIILYENIIEIDPLGDTIAGCPHIFIERKSGKFFDYDIATLVPRGSLGRSFSIQSRDDKRRIKFFPKKLPKTQKSLSFSYPSPDLTESEIEEDANQETKG